VDDIERNGARGAAALPPVSTEMTPEMEAEVQQAVQ
jgi:hypothetical protein